MIARQRYRVLNGNPLAQTHIEEIVHRLLVDEPEEGNGHIAFVTAFNIVCFILHDIIIFFLCKTWHKAQRRINRAKKTVTKPTESLRCIDITIFEHHSDKNKHVCTPPRPRPQP